MKSDKLIIKPKGVDGYKTFSVRIREDVIARVDEVSAQTGRSRNELMGLFLEYALENYEIENSSNN